MLHLHSSKAVNKICPRGGGGGGGGGGGHRCSRGTYEHGEWSHPTDSLIGTMFSAVLAVVFSILFCVVSFVWLLRSDPVARNFLTHLELNSFDGKFLKLYFAWI